MRLEGRVLNDGISDPRLLCAYSKGEKKRNVFRILETVVPQSVKAPQMRHHLQVAIQRESEEAVTQVSSITLHVRRPPSFMFHSGGKATRSE